MRSIKKPSFVKILLIRGAALVLVFMCIAFALLSYLVKTQREKNFNRFCYHLSEIEPLMQSLYEQGSLNTDFSQTYIHSIQHKLDEIWAEDHIYIAAYYYRSKIAETRNRVVALFPVNYVDVDNINYFIGDELQLEDMNVLPPEVFEQETRKGVDPVKDLLDSFSKKNDTFKDYMFREIYTKDGVTALPGMLLCADRPVMDEYSYDDVVEYYDGRSLVYIEGGASMESINIDVIEYNDYMDLTPEDTTGYEKRETMCHVLAYYCPPDEALTEEDVNYTFGYNGVPGLYKLDESIEYSKESISGNFYVYYDENGYRDVTSVRIFPELDWSLKIAYDENPSPFEMMPYTCVAVPVVALLLAVVIALIWSYLKYVHDRSVWEILEYRRKTTEAMAHDLKTPLAAITACVETLQEGFELDPTPHYEVLAQNTATMNRMVEDILGFTRSESGSLKIEPSMVDLDSLIEQSIRDHNTLLKAASLRTDFKGSSVMIETDPKIFKQALDNLFANCARHADPDTTVTVSLTTTELTISNKTSLKVDNVNDLKKPFVKGETSRGHSGTGLGLSIVENNLRLLGYSLDLSLKDSTFTAKIKF